MTYVGRFIAIICALILTACGGGGGNSNPKYSISLDVSTLNFSSQVSAVQVAPQNISVSYKGDGVIVGTPIGTSLPNWLHVAEGVVLGANKANFQISVSVSGLAPGDYQSTLRFITGKSDGSDIIYKDITVNLKIIDVAIPSATTFSFFEVFQKQSPPSLQSLSISTFNKNLQWNIKSNSTWLTVSQASGVGSGDVKLGVDVTGLSLGSYSAILTLSDTSSFQTQIKVSLSVQPRVIYAHRRGIALVKTGNIKKLEDDILLEDTAELPNPNWQISSDQDWLYVSHLPNGKFHIRADDSALINGMSYAKVTISSTQDGITVSEKINVGLYKTDSLTNDGKIADISGWDPSNFTSVAVDPIRPYIYIKDVTNSAIQVFNVHTGNLEVPLPDVNFSVGRFSALTVSSSGNELYALYGNTKLYKYSFANQAWSYVDIATNYAGAPHILELHPNGKSLILIAAGSIVLDPETGKTLLTQKDFFPELFNTDLSTVFAGAGDQKALLGAIGGKLYRFKINVDVAKNTLNLKVVDSMAASTGNLIATNENGSQINFLYRHSIGIPSYSYDPIKGFKYKGDWYVNGPYGDIPVSMAMGDNGILYINASYVSHNVYAYDSEGLQKKIYSFESRNMLMPKNNGMQISGDGTRLLILSTDVSLWGFATIK